MPPSGLPLTLMALANATTPDAPLWNVTPHTPPDHIPRERTALATAQQSLHDMKLLTLLYHAASTPKQALHCTPAPPPRLGLWPVAPLSSALDRETPAGPAFMVQALPQQHSWCSL